MTPEREKKELSSMFKKWKLLKKKKKEPDETFSDWLAQLLTDERELDRMACSMSAFLESENSDVPFCTM